MGVKRQGQAVLDVTLIISKLKDLNMSPTVNRKTQATIEIILVAILFLASRTILGGIKYASQIAEVISLITITFLLIRRGSNWKSLGFQMPTKWLLAFGYFILCVISIALIFNFVIQPLFPHGANEINHGEAISFNEMLIQLLFIGILAAAIGEEMLFRGFLFNNLNEIFGHGKLGVGLAILMQAFLFAILHSGVQGMVSAGVIGVILGVFYIISGRNLIVVMAAHAVPDVLSIISTYQSQ